MFDYQKDGHEKLAAIFKSEGQEYWQVPGSLRNKLLQLLRDTYYTYYKGKIFSPYPGWDIEENEYKAKHNVQLLPNEAKEFLAIAEFKVEAVERKNWGNEGTHTDYDPYVRYKGEWYSLCKTDLMDDVRCGVPMVLFPNPKPRDEEVKNFINDAWKWCRNFGVRIDEAEKQFCLIAESSDH